MGDCMFCFMGCNFIIHVDIFRKKSEQIINAVMKVEMVVLKCMITKFNIQTIEVSKTLCCIYHVSLWPL
jgi:hypothetical protein